MSIQKGELIPNAKLFALDGSGALGATPASELFAGKRRTFAVPGAFTHLSKSICPALWKMQMPSKPRN
jgi:hypothetical protein